MIEPTFTFRNIPATEGLKVHAVQKLGKLSHVVVKPVTVHVILTVEHVEHCAEITVVDSGIQYVGHAKSDDMYASIDAAVAKLLRQLQRHKERVKDHKKKPLAAKSPPA